MKCSLAGVLFLSIRGFIDMSIKSVDSELAISIISRLMDDVIQQEHDAAKSRDVYDAGSPGWETWESQRQHMCGQKLAYQSAIEVIKELS